MIGCTPMDSILVAVGSVLALGAVAFGGYRVLDVAGATVTAGSPAARSAAAPKAASADALDWAVLTGYEYQPGLAGLPDAVKALEGTSVTLRGYLLPLVEFDDIHEFCVVPNHMSCCFGMPAGINGQVQVKLKASERGLPNTNEPLEVRGTLHVVETKDQGILLSIYRIDEATGRIVGY
jgi:hypothetical protein